MKFEREVCLKLGTMETKTESNTMTNLQIVEGKQAQIDVKTILNFEPSNIIYFYTVVQKEWKTSDFNEQENNLFNKRKGQVENIYKLYRVYMDVGISEYSMNIVKSEHVKGYGCNEARFSTKWYSFHFYGRPCILTVDDFTNEFKYDVSIENQIRKIVEINDSKHFHCETIRKQTERQEQIINEQQSQMTLMQSIISSMQNQLQEQSKLIASLQLSLNETQREMRKKQLVIEEEVDILLRDE
jgi:hypothetical protein